MTAEDDIADLLAQARSAVKDGDWATAEDLAARVETLDPDNGDAKRIRETAQERLADLDRPKVFVSSAMEELREERQVVRSVLERNPNFRPWLFDGDANARSIPAKAEWRKQILRRDVAVTVVLLWKKLGKYTQDEIDFSRKNAVATHLFRKTDDERAIEATDRAYLDELQDPDTGLTPRWFTEAKELGKLVQGGLNDQIRDWAEAKREPTDDPDQGPSGKRRAATFGPLVADLLVQVEQAVAAGEWAAVSDLTVRVLALDPDHAEAKRFGELASERSGEAVSASSPLVADLLVQVEQAVAAGEWAAVSDLTVRVLALDPDHAEAKRFGELASERSGEAVSASSPLVADLLVQVEQAVAAGEWAAVSDLTVRVLALDPDHEEAKRFGELASERSGEAVSASSPLVADLLVQVEQAVAAGEWAAVSDLTVRVLALDPDHAEARRLQAAAGSARTSGVGHQVDEQGSSKPPTRGVEQPEPWYRQTPPERQRRLAPNSAAMVGRADEREMLTRLIEMSPTEIIGLVGAPGVGKKALLRHVAQAGRPAGRFADGWAIHPYVDVAELPVDPVGDPNRPPVGTDDKAKAWTPKPRKRTPADLEDLVQAIWAEFYRTGEGNVRPHDRRRDLEGIEAFIVLPDADDSLHLVTAVSELMPKSLFCVTLERPSAAAQTIELGGLSQEGDLLTVFAHTYTAAVPPELHSDIVALCATLAGNPALIGLLGAEAYDAAYPHAAARDPEARTEPHPLAGWAASMRRLGEADLRHRLVSPEAQLVIEVGRDGPAPRRVYCDTVGSERTLDKAHGDGVVATNSPKYQVNPALLADDEPTDMPPRVFDNALTWARSAPTPEIFANQGFVLRMMSWGIEQKKWDDVIRLGRATESAMAVGGRHGAWERILTDVTDAASACEPVDERNLAWALHQRGSRGLLRDELASARALLHDARILRRKQSMASRDVTHHNLSIVPAAITPMAVLAVVAVLLILLIDTALPDAGSPAAIAEIDPDIGSFLETDRADFTVTNVGSAEFEIAEIDVPDGFSLGPTATCQAGTTLEPNGEPDHECTLVVLNDRPVSGPRELVLELTSKGAVRGDRVILLIAPP